MSDSYLSAYLKRKGENLEKELQLSDEFPLSEKNESNNLNYIEHIK